MFIFHFKTIWGSMGSLWGSMGSLWGSMGSLWGSMGYYGVLWGKKMYRMLYLLEFTGWV